MSRRVWEEGASEGRAVIARIGVAPDWATSPHAKAGRLPSGLSYEKCWPSGRGAFGR